MISHLSQELINKIAAGEVVERPSSVVKELVENSIDANADEIIIEVNQDNITVRDNGNGISKEDLSKLFINHSTSKIHSIDDLSSILTMGFRGEAIATISSVSKIKILSKHKNSDLAYEITPSNTPIISSSNQGTEVIVADLFYNVPARKKFLKSQTIENRHIIDTVIRIAIPQPQISFKLYIDNKLVLNLAKTTLESRVKEIIPNISLVPIENDDLLSGYISLPKDSFSKSSNQYMYVNKRYIYPSPAIMKSIAIGYKNSIMRGQHPPYVIFINIDPKSVDINVHPRKTEVKFENEGYIFQKIYTIIQHSLYRYQNTKLFTSNEKKENFEPIQDEKINFFQTPTPIIKDSYKPNVEKALNFSSLILEQDDPLNHADPSTAKQYMLSYITVQGKDEILIFDQHASSERFVFEKYKKYYESTEIKTKDLLIKQKVEDEYADFMYSNQSILSSFGIVLEKDVKDIYITAIPDFSSLRIVDHLYSEIRSILASELSSVLDLREKMFTTLACHSAIRFGDKLADEECKKIIIDLLECKNRLTCPHGRPTYYSVQKSRLKEIFKR